MVALFVSHSSADARHAVRVRQFLEDCGYAALFLDLDPVQGIPGGARWEQELYTQLQRADAVIFLASATSVASCWCFAEISLARSAGKRVFPLRLETGVTHGLLTDTQWIGLSGGELDTERLLVALRAAGLDPRDSFAWDPRRSPYPGLRPFTGPDAAVFFGRESELRQLGELLEPVLQRRARRCVSVAGPSGSGKSSLLHAGLVPRLRRQPDRWVVLPPMVPGRRPLASLARTLSVASPLAGPEAAGAPGARPEGGAPALRDVVRRLMEDDATARRVLLVIDQAEELVTLADPAEQRDFLALLAQVMTEHSTFWTVSAVRSEFLVGSDPDRARLAEIIQNPLLLHPMDRDRLPDVIQRPAMQARITFAPGLVQKMASDVPSGDALPLLAYTLRELYDRIGQRREISDADYDAVGGVVGALRRRADRIVDEMADELDPPSIISTLLRLAAVEGDDEPTRRRVALSDLGDAQVAVVEAFAEARLLVRGTGPSGEATVEIAHEALLRQWPPLRDAIEESRASLRLRSELDHSAADWDRAHRDDSYLLRGARLSTVDEWASCHQAELDTLTREYLESSRDLAMTELRETRRANRRLTVLATGLSLLLLLATGATVAAIASSRTARAEARINLSAQLAAQSDRMVDGEPEIAVLLGLQSLSVARDDTPAPQPPAGLITALARRTHASRPLVGHQAEVSSVACSPDGRLLASAGRDGTVRLWTSTGDAYGPPLDGHTGELSGVAFSADGRFLAAAGDDGIVRVWTTADPDEPVQLMGHAAPVYAVAFSPDGGLLASADQAGNIRLWQVPSFLPEPSAPAGHTAAVYRLAFSPDGTLLASGSWDHTVQLWQMPAGQPWGEPLRHDDEVQSVAFSPDGRLLASTSVDMMVRLWRVQREPQEPDLLAGHTGEVHGAAFSPDGDLLVTTDTTGAVRMWDVPRRRPHGLPLTGHAGSVRDVAFSPDGLSFLTASWDRTIRIWRTRETPSISRRHRRGRRGVRRRVQPRRQARGNRRRRRRHPVVGRGHGRAGRRAARRAHRRRLRRRVQSRRATSGERRNRQHRPPVGLGHASAAWPYLGRPRQLGQQRRLQPGRNAAGLGQRGPPHQAVGRRIRSAVRSAARGEHPGGAQGPLQPRRRVPRLGRRRSHRAPVGQDGPPDHAALDGAHRLGQQHLVQPGRHPARLRKRGPHHPHLGHQDRSALDRPDHRPYRARRRRGLQPGRQQARLGES